MSTTPFVLQALKILGPEEILKLSEVLHVKQVPLKKAAGEEFIVWDDADLPTPQRSEAQPKEAKVLEFPKKSINDMRPYEGDRPEPSEDDEDKPSFLDSDMVLWQREIARSHGDNVQKIEAMTRYRKSTEVYVVKTSDKDGKDKTRFASTNGILINKKQA